MGGAAGGQLASRIATETFVSELEKVLNPAMTPEQLIAASSYAAALANEAIQAAACDKEEYQNMKEFDTTKRKENMISDVIIVHAR
jgi:serine/threonine protein phosphatase PrpC